MDELLEIRRQNLIERLKERGAKTQLAARLGTTQAHISHMLRDPKEKNARPIHEEKAREIERALNMSFGELDIGSIPNPKVAMTTRNLHFADLVLHEPSMREKSEALQPMETREQALKRFARVHGAALTLVTFYDRIELKTGGLTFVSIEQLNKKTVRIA